MRHAPAISCESTRIPRWTSPTLRLSSPPRFPTSRAFLHSTVIFTPIVFIIRFRLQCFPELSSALAMKANVHLPVYYSGRNLPIFCSNIPPNETPGRLLRHSEEQGDHENVHQQEMRSHVWRRSRCPASAGCRLQ